MMKIILGSQSKGRRSVLEEAGYTFEIRPANIDEKAIRSNNFVELPLILAKAKAQKLLTEIKEPAVIITSDQIVLWKNELREKPETKEQAFRYLKSYSTYPAETITAVVVTNTVNKLQKWGVDRVKIYFNGIPEGIINQLISNGEIMHTAGGFRVEDPLLIPYIKNVDGAKDSVKGLPLALTKKLIFEVEK